MINQNEREIKPKRGRPKKKEVAEINTPVETKQEVVKTLANPETKEQIDFIKKDIKTNIILKATAGSGKTYSAVKRVQFLLEQGVPANKIIFFSYTTAAVKEFKKRLNNEEVKVTTIHAFCLGMLSRMKKFKEIVDIYKFIYWYKAKFKPQFNEPEDVKAEYDELINQMFDTAEYISASIAAYKLQTADKIKCPLPKFFHEYKQFTKETKSRDFSDMLIEVRDLLKDNRWLNLFKGQYDYILVDEFQDTSTIQMGVLLALNAKYYTIIGDISQSIYLYSGANAHAVISMLKKRRECVEMSLSTNFRSAKLIVENSNLYSDLQAIPHTDREGSVHKDIIIFEELVKILKDKPEVTILARTNSIIREIEMKLMLRKIPLNYFNYLTESECEALKKAENRPSTTKKMKRLLPVFKTADNVIRFIEENRNQPSFVTSIHKSKGREFPVVVVVNSVSPEILEHNKMDTLDEKTKKEISFFHDAPEDDVENFEAKNIHYVAISRPKDELYYMIMGI